MKSLVNFVVMASFLLGVSLPTGTAAAQDGGPVYIVLEGDTLSSIAIEFGTTVDALVQTNAIADASLIAPGMRLVIPGFEGVNGLLGVHEVVFGESLASLAASVHASAPSLAKLNRLVSPGRLYVGQPAILPESESGAPAAAVAHLLEPGQGRLAAAVAFGVNPWTVSGSPASLWVVPGSRIYLPGGPSPAKDLPSGLDSVGVDPSPVIQGRTTVIELQADPEAAVEARLGESAVNLMSAEDTPGAWVALQGIHALQSPGLLDLEVRVSVDGRTDGFRQPVRVLEAGYGRESLEVPQETLDPANTGPEDARVAEIVRPATRERLWAGLFSFPSTYFETFPSRFGTRRSYNGSAYSYYHTGLDLYGNPETPVLAPAPGIVVFTEKLTVRGNTTYVDHGWGVYSGFLHQSQILVQPGDRVETGEVIGMVGATGRVTGAHLHWEVWVGGVPINPLEWTERPLP